MNNDKLSNQLNLALIATPLEREESLDLDMGYDAKNNTWELIIKYTKDIQYIQAELNFELVPLFNGYGIINISEDKIERLSRYPEIIFIDKPMPMYFTLDRAAREVCANNVKRIEDLSGKGVCVAVIDSGIDYTHPDFRNDDGSTRILAIWDQTISGNPPNGYIMGSLFTKADINAALMNDTFLPTADISGHGTHVAGIACGNGRASNGRYEGVAPNSDMLIVKLGNATDNNPAKTSQIMQAIDFCMKTAIEINEPLVINLSFGNNYGSHNGQNIIEDYINSIATMWKTSIVVGTGNEGSASLHNSGIIRNGQRKEIEISVPGAEFSFNLQFWKKYQDEIEVEIIAPNNQSSGRIKALLGAQDFILNDTRILLYYGSPIPINILQEIYIEFLPEASYYITPGIWKIALHGINVIDGEYNMWLPSGAKLISDTKFLDPDKDISLTIPSTAYRVISVAAYNSIDDSYAEFSGRGYTLSPYSVKPDLCAPGVGIVSCAPNASYVQRSGTSMATPFVAGAAALLMEWGIVKNNDNYMYGEKLKANLINGTKSILSFTEYPNRQIGWGALCIEDSIPF
ncbi:MAG: peptidase S8 [Lachnospira sp.]|nr:peptidase S8 [Lachnospira sp.]